MGFEDTEHRLETGLGTITLTFRHGDEERERPSLALLEDLREALGDRR